MLYIVVEACMGGVTLPRGLEGACRRSAIIIILRGLEGRGAGAGPCDTQADDAHVLRQGVV